MPTVALATAAAFAQLHSDDVGLPAALADLGVDAEPRVWDDPDVDWGSYDLVVVRSCWDYTTRHEEFLAWAASVPALLNPVEVLRWNTDKRYLVELAAAGVPVVPTALVAPGEAFVPPEGEHVVKTTVSAGARDTRRFAAGEDSTAFAQDLLAQGRTLLVQPYQGAVDTAGETALLLFDAELSHAARKAPVLVPDLADPNEVAITATTATPEQLEVARAALAAVPFDGPLLYARVDVVPGPDGSPLLMELELTEPSLFFLDDPAAVRRYASAVAGRLQTPGS